MLKNIKKIKSIHFVGIKGVGTAPLAIIAKEAGFEVTGCDIAEGFITDSVLKKSGIVPLLGFDKSHIINSDLVITTGAHRGYDNPEVVAAKKKGTGILTQGEAVGEFMEGSLFGREQVGISVAGTHGKTTTTAIIATILHTSGEDPSWIIGTSTIPSLGVSGHFGLGKYFVAEADEYANEPQYDRKAKMLLQKPKIAIITNIEHDHPDIYPTLVDVENSFKEFVMSIPRTGLIVACGDDARVRRILENTKANTITYGFSEDNDYVITKIQNIGGMQEATFKVLDKEDKFEIKIMGQHNILNGLGAYIVCLKLGLSKKKIKKGLLSFIGTKRRLEYIGVLSTGALLYDDYAHHPTEIEKTLQALRQKFLDKKILCIFQPHTYSRTRLLLDQFVDSLSLADSLIVAEIYPSAREIVDKSISSKQIVTKLKDRGKKAKYAQNLKNVIQYISKKHYGDDTVIVTMGAGDIYTIANEILEHESAPYVS